MLTSLFICANIYSTPLVCYKQRVIEYNKPIVYYILTTDQKWHTVNRCTGEKTIIGKSLVIYEESKWCE